MSAEPGKKERNELEDSLKTWLGPLCDALDDLSAPSETSDEEFRKQLSLCAEGGKLGPSEKFEKFLEGQIYEGFAKGFTQ